MSLFTFGPTASGSAFEPAIRETLWYPIIESVHVLGIVFVPGPARVLDLRFFWGPRDATPACTGSGSATAPVDLRRFRDLDAVRFDFGLHRTGENPSQLLGPHQARATDIGGPER